MCEDIKFNEGICFHITIRFLEQMLRKLYILYNREKDVSINQIRT